MSGQGPRVALPHREAVVLAAERLITLAGGVFEAFDVDNLDAAA